MLQTYGRFAVYYNYVIIIIFMLHSSYENICKLKFSCWNIKFLFFLFYFELYRCSLFLPELYPPEFLLRVILSFQLISPCFLSMIKISSKISERMLRIALKPTAQKRPDNVSFQTLLWKRRREKESISGHGSKFLCLFWKWSWEHVLEILFLLVSIKCIREIPQKG